MTNIHICHSERSEESAFSFFRRASEKQIPWAKTASLILAFLLALAFLTGMAAVPAGAECKCRRVSEKESTRPGGNEMVIFVEEKSYRGLKGTVQLRAGQPVENALVEIFDRPEYLLAHSIGSANNRPKQRRLAACVASANGKFCFSNLADGKYELRSSSGNGVNVTHVYVVIDKQSGEKKDISVEMTLGT
jgi:hypothetical protein